LVRKTKTKIYDEKNFYRGDKILKGERAKKYILLIEEAYFRRAESRIDPTDLF
jgi:hypothetical protein